MSANGQATKSVIGISSLMRPRYSPGLLLRDDDLRQGVDYTRDLSRLLFRSLFGCGVVCGLTIDTAIRCGKLVVTVHPGVALDCCGDPVHVPVSQDICVDPTCGETVPPEMWVVIRHTEKCCAPRAAACSCDDHDSASVCTRERDGYEIRLVPKRPDCSCGCTVTADAPGPPPPPPPPTIALAKRSRAKSAAAVAQPAPETLVENDGQAATAENPCRCIDATDPCYRDHYAGVCACECGCEWLVLGRLQYTDKTWSTDYRVRRFIRPVFARDPAVYPMPAEQQPS